MGGLRQSARGSRSRRSSASMAPSIDARLTHSARSPQSMRAAPLGMSPTAQRSPRETARVERPNRCRLPNISTFGRSMGIKRSRRKSASVPTCAFPAHRAASTPTLPVYVPKSGKRFSARREPGAKSSSKPLRSSWGQRIATSAPPLAREQMTIRPFELFNAVEGFESRPV